MRRLHLLGAIVGWIACPSAFALAPAPTPLSGSPTFPTPREPHRVVAIDVEDTVRGCFGGSTNSHRMEPLVEHGGIFASEHQALIPSEVDDLLRVIRASEGVALDLERLGLTPEAVARHRNDLKKAALPAHNPIAVQFPDDLAELLEPENILRIARNHIEQRMISTTSFNFRVVFEFADGANIVVESTSELPGKLPWDVTIGDRRWRSWSVDLSHAMTSVVSSNAAWHHALLYQDRYWARDFWTQGSFVWRELQEAVEGHVAESIYGNMEGFRSASAAWRVERRGTIGWINSGPFGLHLMLSKRTIPILERDSDIIDGAWWWNPIVDGRTTATWDDFVAAHARATTTAAKMTWLREWKAAGPGREIELHVVGGDAHGADPLEDSVMPIWRRFGLKRKPEFNVMLRDPNGNRTGEVFFGSEDLRAVVVSMYAIGPTQEPKHWLDAETVSFYAGQGTCLVVQANGTRHGC